MSEPHLQPFVLADAAADFNGMYRLPVAPYPSLAFLNEPPNDRLRKFKHVMEEELGELNAIVSEGSALSDIGLLTEIADLLSDLCVFAHSEAVKFGIPLNDVHRIVMESNASKRNPDGSTTYDDRGKVMKGPDYWKPEPKIRELLESLIPKDQETPATTEGAP